MLGEFLFFNCFGVQTNCECQRKTNFCFSEERWASEGIQVGGIRSARGVIGHWFDKYVLITPFLQTRSFCFSCEACSQNNINIHVRDHDIHGPAGPTAFWKTSDGFRDYEDEAQSSTPYHQTTANVQYNGAEEDEDEEEQEEDDDVFELSGVTASDLVTELQLSGQTTAAQLHDVLTQIVLGHLQQHQNLHHNHDQEEGEDEDQEAEGSREAGHEEDREEHEGV